MKATNNCFTVDDKCRKFKLGGELHQVISQYSDSPNLIGYINSFLESVKESRIDAEDLSRVLDIDCVTGDNLDLLGEILVQPRPFIGIDEPWFTTEDNQPTDPLSAGFNDGKFWDGKSPLLGKTPATDEVYRLFLKSKIAKNVSEGTHNYLSLVIMLISCRDDIMIQGTNGLSEYPFEMYGNPDNESRGLSEGLWDIDDPIEPNPMEITLKGIDRPIDTYLVALFTQYDILPIPAGVKLIVDVS